MEVSNTGALGRKLINSDIVNRELSLTPTTANLFGQLNPNIPSDIVYRSNSGSSDYLALTSSLRYRTSHEAIQVSYTYSHSIDNESDPLLGQSVNGSTNNGVATEGAQVYGVAAYSLQFNSSLDRASSDFDQRQNLVFYSLSDIPVPFRSGLLKKVFGGWQTSELGAFRSGFPYTVFAPIATSGNLEALSIFNSRANYLGGSAAESIPVAGGQQILNPAVFTSPAGLGTLGRNSLTDAGFYSVDASLVRSFAVPRLGEATRLSLRADFFRRSEPRQSGESGECSGQYKLRNIAVRDRGPPYPLIAGSS